VIESIWFAQSLSNLRGSKGKGTPELQPSVAAGNACGQEPHSLLAAACPSTHLEPVASRHPTEKQAVECDANKLTASKFVSPLVQK
jgi:hypothetical protein